MAAPCVVCEPAHAEEQHAQEPGDLQHALVPAVWQRMINDEAVHGSKTKRKRARTI